MREEVTDEALRSSKSVSVNGRVLIRARRALIIYSIVLKYLFPFGVLAISAALSALYVLLPHAGIRDDEILHPQVMM